MAIHISTLYHRAIHNGANWQDDGAKKDTMGLAKSMNGAALPVYLLIVNGDNPILYLYFLARKGNIATKIAL